MNTKFNMKQLLSEWVILLVISLGARCGHSEDYMARKKAEARAEGVNEGNKYHRDVMKERADMSAYNKGLKFEAFVGMLRLISFEEAIGRIGNVTEGQIKEASKDTTGRAAVKYKSNALKGLVSVFVTGGRKTKNNAEAPELVIFNIESLQVQEEGEIIKHSMLGAVKHILTSAMFSGKAMRPDLRVAMFMKLLKSIKKSGLYEKITEIDNKSKEFLRKIESGPGSGAVSSEKLEEARRFLTELERCTVDLKEAVGNYKTDLGEDICDYILDFRKGKGTLKERGTVRLTSFSKRLPEIKNEDPRRELQRALAYVKQMYKDAVSAAERLIEGYRGELWRLGEESSGGGGGAGAAAKPGAGAGGNVPGAKRGGGGVVGEIEPISKIKNRETHSFLQLSRNCYLNNNNGVEFRNLISNKLDPLLGPLPNSNGIEKLKKYLVDLGYEFIFSNDDQDQVTEIKGFIYETLEYAIELPAGAVETKEQKTRRCGDNYNAVCRKLKEIIGRSGLLWAEDEEGSAPSPAARSTASADAMPAGGAKPAAKPVVSAAEKEAAEMERSEGDNTNLFRFSGSNTEKEIKKISGLVCGVHYSMCGNKNAVIGRSNEMVTEFNNLILLLNSFVLPEGFERPYEFINKDSRDDNVIKFKRVLSEFKERVGASNEFLLTTPLTEDSITSSKNFLYGIYMSLSDIVNSLLG